TRFQDVPDAPVTKFQISFFGGKRSLIENHADLCRGIHRARVVFKAQSGRVSRQGPLIGTSCGGK
ncbi:MAG: hypothetical protein ACTHNP_06150, partial [Solirubrobacterales bacterium]